MANAGRKPKRSWVRVPETTPSQRPVDLDDGFISRVGCGSSPPAATKISRCGEVASRAVRDRETGGSIPLTSTTCHKCDMVAMKYTEAMLRKAVLSSETIVDVLRKLRAPISSGMHWHITARIRRYGIDTSHFVGKAHRRGTLGVTRRSAAEILILRIDGHRDKGARLRRALLEIGRVYRCEECKCGPKWRGKDLQLEVDHKNRNRLDNRSENLRFLCPNCHSQN